MNIAGGGLGPREAVGPPSTLRREEVSECVRGRECLRFTFQGLGLRDPNLLVKSP